MPSITIRDVPPEVRDELASRAAKEGRSMQEYLRRALIDMAARPTNREIVARAQERARRLGLRISVAEILAARDADRP